MKPIIVEDNEQMPYLIKSLECDIEEIKEDLPQLLKLVVAAEDFVALARRLSPNQQS